MGAAGRAGTLALAAVVAACGGIGATTNPNTSGGAGESASPNTGGEAGESASPIAGETGDIKVGFLTAFTGLETILGETQYNAYKLAEEEINAAGGIAGRKIVTIKEDDGTDTKQAIEKANKLALQDKVSVIIGMIASLEREAVLSVSPGLKTPVIYTTYYEGAHLGARACDKYYISTGQVPNQQVDLLVPWLTENVGKSYYVVGSDYIWPRGTTEALQAAVDKAGGEIVHTEFFPFGTTDFSGVFRDLESKKPDIAFVMVAGGDAVTFNKQWKEFQPSTRLVAIGIDDIFAPGAPVGTLASQAYFMNVETEANKRFVKAYQDRFGAGKPVNAIGEAAYDALYLFKLAVEKAGGSTDPAKWIPALSEVEFDAPQGKVRIDKATQHMVTQSLIGEVQADGTMKTVENFGTIPPVVEGCDLSSAW